MFSLCCKWFCFVVKKELRQQPGKWLDSNVETIAVSWTLFGVNNVDLVPIKTVFTLQQRSGEQPQKTNTSALAATWCCRQ
jgi:hypothetical protein